MNSSGSTGQDPLHIVTVSHCYESALKSTLYATTGNIQLSNLCETLNKNKLENPPSMANLNINYFLSQAIKISIIENFYCFILAGRIYSDFLIFQCVDFYLKNRKKCLQTAFNRPCVVEISNKFIAPIRRTRVRFRTM